jgi:lincosamide nucleotidyltransferase A/C/D/E
MTTRAADVLRVLDLLRGAGIDAWLDGGWAVDALLGEQTRDHNDLDLAVRVEDRARYDEVMSASSFHPVREDVCSDGPCEVDVHFVDLDVTHVDERGIEVYGGIAYEAGEFTGAGTILGQPVLCCSPASLVRYHAQYEPDADDFDDVRALCERFGIPLPPRFTPR